VQQHRTHREGRGPQLPPIPPVACPLAACRCAGSAARGWGICWRPSIPIPWPLLFQLPLHQAPPPLPPGRPHFALRCHPPLACHPLPGYRGCTRALPSGARGRDLREGPTLLSCTSTRGRPGRGRRCLPARGGTGVVLAVCQPRGAWTGESKGGEGGIGQQGRRDQRRDSKCKYSTSSGLWGL